jgi:hypothetical protein
MNVRFLPVAAILAGLVAAHAPAGANPLSSGYGVSAPVTHGNLAVYFVHRGAGGAAQPLALHEAMANGSARITAPRNALPTIDNLSDRPIFVPAGALLKGGMQDQVVVSTVIIPPHATGVSLAVLCVENGRSEPRVGDDSTRYSMAGNLLPSRVGTLSILTSGSASPATMHLRQFGVWLAVDSIRTRLSERLGAPIASPRSPSSLPLALENELIEQAQQPFVATLQGAGEAADDISGAVFAIDGRLVAADLYASNDLFRQMWPSLLRAHAIQSLMAPSGAEPALPSIESVQAFLGSASRDPSQVRTLTSYDGWVHMGHAANAPAGATGLERTVLRLLATRELDAERAGALTRQQVRNRVLAAAEKEGEGSQTAMQQANRAGLFNEPPLRPLLPQQGGTSASPRAPEPAGNGALLALAVLALLLCARRSIVHRLIAGMRSVFLPLWATLLNLALATNQFGSSRAAKTHRRPDARTILSRSGHVPLVPGNVAVPQLSRSVRSRVLVDA